MGELSNAIPELDRKGLREFGLVTGGLIAVLFGGILPFVFGFQFPIWPWIVALVLVTWALLAPGSLRPVYQVWMRFALLLNRITTPIVLGVVFFVAIMPTGFIMRVLRKDPMARKLDEEIDTYRTASREAPRKNMEKPF